MKNRDQFVDELKARLDRWNADATRWEARAGKLRDAQWKAFEARREEALYQLKLLEKASAAAFEDASAGAERAWKALAEAYDQARSHFEKSERKSRA